MTQLEHQSRGQFNAPNLEFPEGRGWEGDETTKTFLSMGIFLNDTGMALDDELMANKWATKFSNPHFIWNKSMQIYYSDVSLAGKAVTVEALFCKRMVHKDYSYFIKKGMHQFARAPFTPWYNKSYI